MTSRRLAGLLCLPLLLTAALAQDGDGDGIPDEVERQLGSDPAVAESRLTIAEDGDDQGVGGPSQANDLAAIACGHVAGDRWLWRITFHGAAAARGNILILYVDADHNPATGRQDKPGVTGTDIMYTFSSAQGSETLNNATFKEKRPGRARYVFTDEALYICDDLALAGDRSAVTFRCYALSQPVAGGMGDATEWCEARVPRSARTALPAVERPRGKSFRGLPGEAVTPPKPRQYPRPRPPVPFAARARTAKPAGVAREQVAVEVLEEHGRARTGAFLAFGFPLPAGAIFDPGNLRLLDAGREVPLDVAVTSWWPDDSLRWTLLSASVALGARQRKLLTVEYGGQVRRQAAPGLDLKVSDTTITADTGAARFTVGLDPLDIACATGANGSGYRNGRFILTDDRGTEREPRVAKAVMEYAGARRAVVRVEAPYADAAGQPSFRAIVRLTFTAGSAAVEVAHTLVNDHLDWEFSDFRSLTFRLEPAVGRLAAANYQIGPDAGPLRSQSLPAGPTARLAVPSDAEYRLGDQTVAGRTVGLVTATGDGGGLSVGVVDFWQRYPKALRCEPTALTFDLFPDQRGPAGPPKDLPHHLAFPFVEGFYRFKWGMSTTDRFVLAPVGGGEAADAVQTVVPVVPAEHYERTGALGELAAPRGKLYQGWDQQLARALAEHLALKEKKREYGFFNWGDWHGERETNWGNNEYDLPHGLFLHFARTGDRTCYRLALAGARHQADVDIIHAYPDPSCVGGNTPHSEAHNGEWSQDIKDRSWSHAHGAFSYAWNGHTWSSGMCDAWYLAGEPRVMEAALSLGEHIAWQMAPTFTQLGTHERSAGWSGHAIAELYHATLDPAYRQALDRILEVAFREQKLDGNGSWPHLLPPDHAAGVAGATGNVAFLIGILLDAIDDQYAIAPSDRAATSLTAGAGWLTTLWLPEYRSWQYTSSPAYRDTASFHGALLNSMTAAPLLRVAELRGDQKLLQIATEAFIGCIAYGLEGFGKSFAQTLHFGPRMMARLEKLGAPSKPYGRLLSATAAEIRAADLGRTTAPKDLALRGPTDKWVIFRHGGGAASFTARRIPWGARPKEEPEGQVTLTGPDGQVVRAESFDTDARQYRFTATLPAAPAGEYRLHIHDDMRGRWDATGSSQRVVAVKPYLHLGGPGAVRWYFLVPAGTAGFAVKLDSLHGGALDLIVAGPDAQPLAEGPALAVTRDGSKSVTARVTVPAALAGKVWSLIAMAGGDLSLALDGVPPYLATAPDAWFEPR